MRGVQVFADEIQKRRRQELHDLTVAVRHSQGTDQQMFKEFLASLGDDADGQQRVRHR